MKHLILYCSVLWLKAAVVYGEFTARRGSRKIAIITTGGTVRSEWQPSVNTMVQKESGIQFPLSVYTCHVITRIQLSQLSAIIITISSRTARARTIYVTTGLDENYPAWVPWLFNFKYSVLRPEDLKVHIAWLRAQSLVHGRAAVDWWSLLELSIMKWDSNTYLEGAISIVSWMVNHSLGSII